MWEENRFFRSRITGEVVGGEIEIPWREDPDQNPPPFSVITIAAMEKYLFCSPLELPGIRTAEKVCKNGVIGYENFYNTDHIGGLEESERSRYYVSLAVKCQLTHEHGVVVPDILLDLVQIKNKYIVFGMIDFFEIWSKQHWQEEEARIRQKL